METDDSMSMSGRVYTYLVHTVWEWNEDQICRLRESWNEIERRYHVEISFIPEKQAFKIKSSSDGEMGDVRKEFFKLLHGMSDEAKIVLTVPPRKAERVSEKPNVIKNLRPPPLDDDDDDDDSFPFIQGENTESIKKVFRFSHPIGNLEKLLRHNREINEPDAWDEICRQCEVTGDVVLSKKVIHFTGGSGENIDRAVKRLKKLEEIYNRTPVKIEVPLVHFSNATIQFKLSFLKLDQHSYFSKVFKTKSKDPYIIVPAMKNPSNKKWMTPFYGEKSRGVSTGPENTGRNKNTPSKEQDFDSFNWPAVEPPKIPVPWTDSPSTSSSLRAQTSSSEPSERLELTEEQKKARKDSKKLRMAEARKNRAIKFEGAEGTSSERASSAWYEPPEPIDEKKHEDDERMNVPIRPINLEKGPNDARNPNKPPGIVLRSYNLSQMQQAFKPGLEYARTHKGDVKFFGSLGKVFFTNVHQEITKNLWEFSDLKDVIVGEHRVRPSYLNFLTDSEYLSGAIAGKVFGEKIYKVSSFFEITADARISIGHDYTQVFMYVDCAVSLDKVALAWDRHVDAYWTVLDGNFDLATSLSTRRCIRSDVKPFTTFIKKTAISPNKNVISCENIENYLEVKSINFKTVTSYKLHSPYIAELTRIEQRTLIDQPTFNKVVGKSETGKVHWTLELVDESYNDLFAKNKTLGVGKVSEWTVENVLGEDPDVKKLVEFIRSMLILTSRCSMVVEESKNS